MFEKSTGKEVVQQELSLENYSDLLKYNYKHMRCYQDQQSEMVRATAKGLIKNMKDWIIATIQIASTLCLKSPISGCLQSKKVDYGYSKVDNIPKVIAETKATLQILRSNEEWDKIVHDVSQFAHNNDELISKLRPTKQKRCMDELAIDETIWEPSKKITIEVFLAVFDLLCLQIKDRFPEKSRDVIWQMYFSDEGLIVNKLEKGKPQNPQSRKSVFLL